MKKLYGIFIHNLKHLSIKNKLFSVVVIQAIILITGFVYIISVESYKTIRQAENTNFQACVGLLSAVSENIKTMTTISTFPILRDNLNKPSLIYQILSTPGATVDNFEYYSYFNENAGKILDLYTFVDTIAIYDLSGNGVYMDRTGSYYMVCKADPNSGWFKAALKGKGSAQAIFPSDFTKSGLNLDEKPLFCVSRAIVNAEKYKNVGIIVVGVQARTIDLLFDNNRQFNNQTYNVYYKKNIVVGNMQLEPAVGRYLESPEPLSKGKTIYVNNNGTRNMYNLYSYGSDYTAVVKTSVNDIRGNMKSISMLFWILVGFLLVMAVIITFFIANSIIKPVNALVYACNKFEKEDFSIQVKGTVSRELSELFSAFNSMSRRVKVLINEVLLRDIAKREFELQLLRSQINPHFLYNTLECMRMMAYTKKNYDVADMAALLGHNLQYGLREINSEVTVREEVSSVSEYIKLVRYHYGSKLQTNINFAQEISECKIIKLILQPLVENAILHGSSAAKRTVTVDIMGYQANGLLTFIVTDDGNGIPVDILKSLRNYLDSEIDNKGFGIGLKNVNRRIKLFYGDAYGLSIESLAGHGTSVILTLPVK